MKLIFGVAVLIVALVGVYMLIASPPETFQIDDFEMYENAIYDISFAYPSTYALQEREVGDGHRYHYSITLIDKETLANVPQNGEGPPSITIDIFQNNLDKLSIEDWVRGTSFSNFKLSPDGRLASSTVANAPALSYTWDGLYRGESVVFAHPGAAGKDNIIMLSVTSLTHEDSIRSNFAMLLASISLY